MPLGERFINCKSLTMCWIHPIPNTSAYLNCLITEIRSQNGEEIQMLYTKVDA